MRNIKWPVEVGKLPKRFAVIVKDDPELSRQVQEYFMEHLNAVWWGRTAPMVMHVDKELLYFTLDKTKFIYEITYGTIDMYDEHRRLEAPEVFVKLGITSLEIEGTTTQIDGKEYDLRAVQEALKRAGVQPV